MESSQLREKYNICCSIFIWERGANNSRSHGNFRGQFTSRRCEEFTTNFTTQMALTALVTESKKEPSEFSRIKYVSTLKINKLYIYILYITLAYKTLAFYSRIIGKFYFHKHNRFTMTMYATRALCNQPTSRNYLLKDNNKMLLFLYFISLRGAENVISCCKIRGPADLSMVHLL